MPHFLNALNREDSVEKLAYSEGTTVKPLLTATYLLPQDQYSNQRGSKGQQSCTAENTITVPKIWSFSDRCVPSKVFKMTLYTRKNNNLENLMTAHKCYWNRFSITLRDCSVLTLAISFSSGCYSWTLTQFNFSWYS